MLDGSSPGHPMAEAAFLDFDRTLVDCDAGVVLGRALARDRLRQIGEGSLRERLVGGAELAARAGGLLAREGALRLLHRTHLARRSDVVRQAYELLEGLPAEELLDRTGDVFREEIADRFYPAMVEEVARHRKRGRRIVIVTTGLTALVRHAEDVLGEVDVIGCEPVVEDGRFTGEVRGPLEGTAKRRAVEAFARDQGVDLAESYAYSDHASDLPFLEAAGHPVAVNPDDALREVAEDRGWTVLSVDLDGEAR